MSNERSGSKEHKGKETFLTNPDYRATMCPVSKNETPGWWIYPAATLLYEEYLGFIARYDIE